MRTFSSGKSVRLDLKSPFPNRENDDSDIDFADVFGGPPRRRSSVHEVMRHGFGESAADFGSGGGGEVIKRRGRWSGADEKPVFGEETTNRRRLTTDDFFNDIFGGKETTPRRRSEWDGIGSKPGSRVLSPAPPLPPKAEPLRTSLPPPLSLPAKLPERTELPTFGSPARTLSKTRHAVLNGSGTYSYSPLSVSSSLTDLNRGQENVTNGSTDRCDADEVQEKGNDGSQVSGRVRQFHFSIYEWPNRGVPVVMLLGRFGSSRFRGQAYVEPKTLNDVRLSCSDDEAFVDTESSDRGADENTDVKDKEAEHDMLSQQHFSGEAAEDASVDVSEVQRPKPNPNFLRSFLFDNDDEQGEGGAREDKSKVKKTRHSGGSRSEKKPGKRRGSSDSIKSAKPGFSSSSPKPGAGEVRKNGVKGKVKEFVKIFNQGPSILSGGDPLGQSSRWRGKENTVIDINKTTDVDQTEQMSGGQKKQSLDSPAVGQKPSRVSEKKDSNTWSMNNKGSHGVSGQESSTAQTTPEDADESFHVNFQVREISEDENKLPRDDPGEIQIIDANIRKWSNGKDGNIRSLLSTLQYILWPESGWKPVPLMEMIEGNAVRKSYQKALLILHPDKLQQKGASANQKYIAERVFKLLQEAWEGFNLLGPL